MSSTYCPPVTILVGVLNDCSDATSVGSHGDPGQRRGNPRRQNDGPDSTAIKAAAGATPTEE